MCPSVMASQLEYIRDDRKNSERKELNEKQWERETRVEKGENG